MKMLDDIYKLLKVAKMTLDFPNLKNIHDRAVKELEEISANTSTGYLTDDEEEEVVKEDPKPVPEVDVDKVMGRKL